MTVTADPWTSSTSEATGRKLLQLTLPVLEALANGDRETACSLSDQPLTPYLVSDECRHVWERRRAQIKEEPRDAVWVTRLVVDSRTGAIVGRGGFHGRPNEDGMVEVGYSIDPLHRRQGHARAAVTIPVDMARRDQSVRVVRATVRPDNVASRALIDQYGFREVGEQWDEEDGLEVILELSVA